MNLNRNLDLNSNWNNLANSNSNGRMAQSSRFNMKTRRNLYGQIISIKNLTLAWKKARKGKTKKKYVMTSATMDWFATSLADDFSMIPTGKVKVSVNKAANGKSITATITASLGRQYGGNQKFVITFDYFKATPTAEDIELKKIIPRQLFEVVIQAATGSKILARESIPPLRKDVNAKLYGGDYTRKMKLLKKQKAGKKKMKSTGKIILDKEVFWKFLK